MAPQVHEGALSAAGKRVAIVVARYNDSVTQRLLKSAVDCFDRHGVADADVAVYWVPGAFEVPQLARKVAASGKVDGIVCLGAIIRGDTNHFDNLCDSVIASVADISARNALPVTYGIVTAENLEQAMDRAGGKNGNKGWDGAIALVEMMSLWGED